MVCVWRDGSIFQPLCGVCMCVTSEYCVCVWKDGRIGIVVSIVVAFLYCCGFVSVPTGNSKYTE